MATTAHTALTLIALVQTVMMVKAQSLSSTYIATPEAAAAGSGGGVVGRSNAVGCGRVCGQNTTCRGYFVADNSADSCLIFTDGNNGAATLGTGTYYWKVPGADTPRTCAEMARQLGTDLPDGQYQIDPDGPGGLDPITVTCQTLTAGTGGLSTVTYAAHDRLSTDTVFGSNTAWEVEYGYRHTITYNDSVTQLRALVTLSYSCRMNVRIKCYKVLFEDIHGRQLAGWVAYNGKVYPMTQGGDVCPLDSSLDTRKCSCNNNAAWYTDTGYLTDTANFPISALAFGDMGPGSETLKITLGPMECVGFTECASPPEITFTTKVVEGQAVGQMVTYYCFPGLVFGDGSNWMVIACMPGGFWERPPYTQCQLATSENEKGGFLED